MDALKGLKFDWVDRHYAEVDWQDMPVAFIIDCFKSSRRKFKFEIEQIIFDCDGDERAFDVPVSKKILKSASIFEAKIKAVSALQDWVTSGNAERLMRAAFHLQ
ncbi:hypothetical protein PH547_04195 [Rhizobium sp. CNPSo 3464]|uniref:hypothetical protein n=1 Tax=Rhizobium sp. CNPSo 3464 TaxID=3021406 RepID=UPI00254C9805|nr:hypothetical protein [Rhizobium sp. CNPSo 3464]MDK4738065.1 hypothetical protein [Rhizobium sp. CNPSo 3464]